MPLIRYVFSVLLYILLLPISTPAAFIVSTWTRPDDIDWGGWFGTYDNPPQGDRKWLKDHPKLRAGAGYLNRVGWIRPQSFLYGLKALWLAVDYTECTTRKFRGNPAISDKYKVPGWLFVTHAATVKSLRAFEWYSVTPYTKSRCLRIRLGWKIKG